MHPSCRCYGRVCKETSIILGGTPERPQAQLTAQASGVSLGSHSLETLTLSGELQGNSRLAGNITATGLVADQQQLGKLDFSLAGTLAKHQSTFKLSDGIVDVKLRASGAWQDGHLTQSFEYGQIQPDGLNSWQLKHNPNLRLSAQSGKISAHCWQQQRASICIDSSNWSSDSLQSKIVIVHTPDRAAKQHRETIVTGDIEVLLGDQVRFNSFGLNSRLDGGLKLTQTRGGFLRSSGTVRVRDGFLTGYGKELRVDRGELTFTGPLDDPLINIQVSRESIYEGRQYTIGLRLTGSAQQVKTEPFSRPAMSENDVLMFLMLDRPISADDNAGGAALAPGLQQLVPLEGSRFGLDEVSFETNEANEAAMVAGKRINDKLYVRYVFGAMGQAGAFRIRYRLGRGFSLESSTGSQQSLDLIYMIER
ncbi:MAG: hypothetical protein GQ573_00975 [Gammaproteobacteria bacterium]|nr:hypothetical protein [Gammaproteobacteria bacterium]